MLERGTTVGTIASSETIGGPQHTAEAHAPNFNSKGWWRRAPNRRDRFYQRFRISL
jgi:hypothetical protein